MKFKILEIEQKGNNLQVVISHKECNRQVFSFPIDLAENNKYIEEIQRILFERENAKKAAIDESIVGKEIDIEPIKAIEIPSSKKEKNKKS